MAGWDEIERRLSDAEAEAPSPRRRAIMEVLRSGGAVPRAATKYLATLPAPDGSTICVEHWEPRPDVWFDTRQAGLLERAGLPFDLRQSSEGRNSNLNSAAAFGARPALRVAAPSPTTFAASSA